VRSWEDWWVSDRPLTLAYSRLYNPCFDENTTYADIFQKGWDSVGFLRTLRGDTLHFSNNIKKTCGEGVILNEEVVKLI
jgi:hypothetical protein